MSYKKVRDGIFYNPKLGRIVNHQGYSTSIHWSTSMLDYLRRHFPTTLNEELAGCLGVSVRTMIRKARELGLQKDPVWLRQVWEERRKMGHIRRKRMGWPGAFQKGQHSYPDGEYKPGHNLTDEQRAKRVASLQKYYRLNPKKARAKALKAWETRRMNNQQL